MSTAGLATERLMTQLKITTSMVLAGSDATKRPDRPHSHGANRAVMLDMSVPLIPCMSLRVFEWSSV